ncbi:Peroxisomal membrane protein PEX30 [Leucoagaricus sp. SymC.cos]|nr:Peroxisomal membrane protein PEX30 [Leucoagaricus sp. SymC.cos]
MVDVLAHFVDSVPQPLTDALVQLRPAFAVAARASRLAAWNDDWYSSWLAVAAWWLLFLAWVSRRHPAPLVTETVLQNAIADLAALRSALPTIPPVSLPPIALLRAAAILTVPWLVLTYLVPSRILIAIIGSFFIAHRAPWARVLRSVLWKSAFVRTGLHTAQAFLTGQSLPKFVVSNQPTPTTPAPVPALRFLFSVYENQRWWMGLDWTAALLPSERPSWCSPALHPMSPPNAFTLPEPTTVYLPAPDGKSRIKRTAIWKWEEPEWRLLVRKEGSSLSRIERALPVIDESSLTSSASATSSSSRLFKAAANKFKESSSSIALPQSSSSAFPPAADSLVLPQDTNRDDSGEPFTDPDGWIYGDNKWENQSHRGGLGKYTRYRRWTRIAIVSEVVEVVSPGALGVHNPSRASFPTQSNKVQPSSPTSSRPKTQSPEPSDKVTIASITPTPSTSSSAIAAPEPESPLRQRLRAALSKSSISSTSS